MCTHTHGIQQGWAPRLCHCMTCLKLLQRCDLTSADIHQVSGYQADTVSYDQDMPLRLLPLHNPLNGFAKASSFS